MPISKWLQLCKEKLAWSGLDGDQSHAFMACCCCLQGDETMTHRKLGANVEGDSRCHGKGHKRLVLLGQRVSQAADQDGGKEEPNAHLYAVLWQC